MKLASLMFVAAFGEVGAAEAQDATPLMKRYDCYTCHANEEAKTGPAFIDVAAKYRGNPEAVAILTTVLKKGRHGEGPWPMPPLPQVPDTDAKKIASYILSLKQ